HAARRGELRRVQRDELGAAQQSRQVDRLDIGALRVLRGEKRIMYQHGAAERLEQPAEAAADHAEADEPYGLIVERFASGPRAVRRIEALAIRARIDVESGAAEERQGVHEGELGDGARNGGAGGRNDDPLLQRVAREHSERARGMADDSEALRAIENR